MQRGNIWLGSQRAAATTHKVLVLVNWVGSSHLNLLNYMGSKIA